MKEKKVDRTDWCLQENEALKDFDIIRPIRSGKNWTAYMAEDSAKKRFTIIFIEDEKILEHQRILAYQAGIPAEEIEEAAKSYLEKYLHELREATERVKGLKHQNVATIHGYNFDEERDQLVIITDYTPGIDMFYFLTKLKPLQSLFIFKQILEGLEFIHNNGFLHLNLKPTRVMVDIEANTPHAKITDFGFAIPIGDYKSTLSGSLYYMAPEVALGQHDKVDERADLFSLAVTMYYCLTHRQPLGDRFIAQANRQRLLNIIEKEKSVTTPPSHYNKLISPELDELILNLMEKDPDKRSYTNARKVISFIEQKWPEESSQMLREGTTTLAFYD